MPMLVDIKPGETLTLEGNGRARITAQHKSGASSRLSIDADDAIRITRPERMTAAKLAATGVGRMEMAPAAHGG